MVADDEERIALFLDYENLAIGAREARGAAPLDFRPIADALAERGRVVVRRAYADWSRFGDDRRELTRHHVELIEIPQRMGVIRKNAADIKMAVDAIELAYEREFVTTFAIGTGDSDFTPLMHKLREMDKRVIGIGVQSSTSKLLPAACDEFLFYDRLPGVEGRPVPPKTSRRRPAAATVAPVAEPEPVATPAAEE
ncbi:MAG: NYN domain-containing protein, partial [Acidimicrobiia bacterium]